MKHIFLLLAFLYIPFLALADAKFDKLKAEAEAGDLEAQCDMGDLYYTGKGVEKDFSEAFKYFQMAANVLQKLFRLLQFLRTVC